MRQFTEGYLSLYRLSSDAVYRHTPQKHQYLILPVQMLASLYFIPLTHEEGHRSVLTNLSIGSVSDPLFKRGVAKVVGVTDLTLQHLRDTNLPEYIRLHTAGLESDYMLTKREQQLVAFGQEKLKNVIGDFYPRRLGIAFYFISSAFSTKNHIEAEEGNELERDIVGDDIRGAVRHLHRPTDSFYRYTNYADLLPNERKYIRKVGFWSLLNIANPMLFGKSTFAMTQNLSMSFGLGYILVPFGTMAEENIWISYRNNNNISLCVRQYSNQRNTFWGAELALFDKLIGRHCAVSGSVQGWKQPQDLSFTTNKGTLGGAAMLRLGYRMYGKTSSPFQWLSVDGNVRVKTEGFIPEDPSLKSATNLAIGISVCPN
ncbi:hypothetical protein [Spirosoma montaniterrae]|uniref:Uncharacterized protein n=1 Tax=Spirosoma montaniterrae TaxID=1178516 RepID=A0A1P9WSB8_9BACT|nr:hypothetical protein [Spirosoma montaniterrae]AQG78268.1 hypothetical protein AWR27_02270 [Spirosoma montaniterrae]